MKLRWIFALLLTAAMYAQSVQSGHSAMSGLFGSQNQAKNGGPLTYSARTDMAVFGAGATGELLPPACGGNAECLANAYNANATTGHQGAALSYTGSPTMAPPAGGTSVSGTNISGLNSYLAGYNKQVTDPDFGTTMIRATDATLYDSVDCLGGSHFGTSFSMGSGTNNISWAVDDSKIRLLPMGGSSAVLAFNPTSGVVTPSDLCGGYFPGSASFSGTNADVIFTVNNDDKENTVPFTSQTGTLLTQETVQQSSTNATAELLALNSNFVQLGPVNGTADNTHVWTGQTSGATFTPNSSYAAPGTNSTTPYANTVYEGVICDGSADAVESVCGTRNRWYGTANACASAGNSTTPACWYVQWSLVFNFNYVSAMVGDSHFPAASGNCLPAGYDANFTGVFSNSTDDTSFTILFGDNGQANHTGYNGGGDSSNVNYACAHSPGGVCQGPVYVANYRTGYGCRVFNAMTDQITGDWGPTGQALNGQANIIAGTVTGTPAALDAWTQDTTGAVTQLTCLQNSSGQCATSAWTKALTGLIYGTTDSSHTWRDSNGASLAPSAAPVNAPFFYPDMLHESSQMKNPLLGNVSMVQQPNMKVTSISYNASTHQTTVLYNNNATYNPGQQFIFYNLAGAHDAYLECTSANNCPVFTAVAVPDGSGWYLPSGSNGTITITDTLGGGSNYADSESQSGCGNSCPIMAPNPQLHMTDNGYSGEQFWQTQTLIVNPILGDTGHHSNGDHTIFKGGKYTAENAFNPSMPATISYTGSGANADCYAAGSPCGSPYPGPATPPPNDNELNLMPTLISEDQHGFYGHSGTTDQTPPGLITEDVCGQAESGGVGGFLCPSQYQIIWDSEIIAIENWVTRSSPGNLVGADCNYSSGAAPCVYRLGHTFNTNDNWAFTGQNSIGISSPDGNYVAFPSDWNKTLGCMDRTTTNCWSSWQATAPTASGTAVSWTSDSASPPNVTITMTNSFCPTGGNQYYWTNSAIQTIACGTRAGTVKLTGFASGETWINNQTLTLGANTANNWQCDSTDSNAGVCNKFVLASVAGAPANSSGTETGTQKATPTGCGGGIPCQRTDIWIANITTAHQ